MCGSQIINRFGALLLLLMVLGFGWKLERARAEEVPGTGLEVVHVKGNTFSCTYENTRHIFVLDLPENTEGAPLVIMLTGEGISSFDAEKLGGTLNKDFVIENGVLKRYRGNENRIVIPGDVKIISSWAFRKCIHITDVTIPDSVTEMQYI